MGVREWVMSVVCVYIVQSVVLVTKQIDKTGVVVVGRGEQALLRACVCVCVVCV